MLTESEARQLAKNTRHALLMLEKTLTAPEQKAAADALHKYLHDVASELKTRWGDLFPDADAEQFAAFSIGGDKTQEP